jgi:hypothetical protein
MKKSKKDLVTVYLEGGTGNQLFMYFAGLALSIRNNSALMLETKYIGEFGTDHGSFLSELNFKGTLKASASPTKLERHVVRILNALIRRSAIGRRIQVRYFGIYRSNEIGYDPKIFKLKGSVNLHGYFQSWKYYDFCSKHTQADLELKEPSELFERISEEITAAKTVVVHVRRGDYAPLSETFGMLAEEYYVNSLNSLFSSHGKHRIWVFSDDINVVRTTFSNPIWNDANFTNFDLNPIETILLMSKASSRIISNSSFSYWSALLSKEPSKNISPKTWFRSQQSPAHLIPPGWNLVESVWLD